MLGRAAGEEGEAVKYERCDAKQWARDNLRDYVVCLTTPFDPDLKIDETGLRRNVEYFVNLERIGGIYVGGLYQESMSMTVGEQKLVTEIVLDAVGGRLPVMVSASSPSVDVSIELARHAEGAGADLLMVWPPQLGYRTATGVMEYFRTISRSVDIGISLYATKMQDFGFYVDASMLEELAEEENICAVKEASFDLATYLATLERVGERLVVSCPLEEMWLYGRLMLGDRYAAPVLLGTSRPLYLQTPEQPYLGRFLDAVETGDLAKISTTLRELLYVANLIHNKYVTRGEHNVAIAKAASGMLGLASGGVRAPLSWPTEQELWDVRAVLSRARLIEHSSLAS